MRPVWTPKNFQKTPSAFFRKSAKKKHAANGFLVTKSSSLKSRSQPGSPATVLPQNPVVTQQEKIVQLLTAAGNGDTQTVARFIAEHPDCITWKATQTGCPMLHYAALGDQIETARLLIAAGADVNAHDDGINIACGGTAIYYAAQRGYVDMVRFLLDHGADPSAKATKVGDWSCQTPAQAAAACGHQAVIDLLEKKTRWSSSDIFTKGIPEPMTVKPPPLRKRPGV